MVSMPDRVVVFISESWKYFDGSVEGLNRDEATTQHGGGGAAWLGQSATSPTWWTRGSTPIFKDSPLIHSSRDISSKLVERASAATGRKF